MTSRKRSLLPVASINRKELKRAPKYIYNAIERHGEDSMPMFTKSSLDNDHWMWIMKYILNPNNTLLTSPAMMLKYGWYHTVMYAAHFFVTLSTSFKKDGFLKTTKARSNHVLSRDDALFLLEEFVVEIWRPHCEIVREALLINTGNDDAECVDENYIYDAMDPVADAEETRINKYLSAFDKNYCGGMTK